MDTLAELHYTSTNYPDQLVDAINKLRRKEEFCDVCLQIDDLFIPAHRVILSASCPYFNKLLSASTTEKNLRLFNINKNGVKSIVEFFYTSAISITEDNVTDLLTCAITLQLKEIETVCCDFVLGHLTVDNAVRVYEISWRNRLAMVKQAAEYFICSNFELLMQNDGFRQLTIDDLLGLLESLSEVLQTEQISRVCDQLLTSVPVDRHRVIVQQMIHMLPDLRRHFKERYPDVEAEFNSSNDIKQITRVHTNKVPSKMALRRMHGASKHHTDPGTQGLQSEVECIRSLYSTGCDTKYESEGMKLRVDKATSDDKDVTTIIMSSGNGENDLKPVRMYNTTSLMNSKLGPRAGMGTNKIPSQGNFSRDVQPNSVCKSENDASKLRQSGDEKINTERAVNPLFSYPESEPIAVAVDATHGPATFAVSRFHTLPESTGNGDAGAGTMDDVVYNYTLDGGHELSGISTDCYVTVDSESDTSDTSQRSPSARKHNNDVGFDCIMCDKTFLTNTDLLIHLQTHGDNSSYSCQQCAKTFSTAVALFSHQKVHTVMFPRTNNDLDKAMIVRHPEIPNTTSLHPNNLAPDLPNEANSRYQNEAYDTQTDINTPLKDTPEKPFSCDICSASFSKKIRLKRHVAIHSGEKKHQCSICNKHFSRSDHLRRHIRTIHCDTSEFTCVCGKVCKRRYEYTKHLQAHELEGMSNIIQQQSDVERRVWTRQTGLEV